MSAALRVEQATFSHLARREPSLAPTSFTVEHGEIVAIVGRSGTGKSTLAEIILALRRPDSGHVEVDDQLWISQRNSPRRDRRHLVQGVPQDAGATFIPRLRLGHQIERAVHRLNPKSNARQQTQDAWNLAKLDPKLLLRKAAEVSGGQAQRAAIARALAADPTVLVADEPTSALDRNTADAVTDSLFDLREHRAIGIVLITHDPLLAARCDRTITLNRVVEG